GGFEVLATLIEDRLRETGPAWFRDAAVLERIENYLGSGSPFAYCQVGLQPVPELDPAGQPRTAEVLWVGAEAEPAETISTRRPPRPLRDIGPSAFSAGSAFKAFSVLSAISEP